LIRSNPEVKKYLSKNPIARFLINRFLATINQFIKQQIRPKKILDAGCGAGFVIEFLLNNWENEVEIAGVDIDPEMINLARTRNPSVTIVGGDIYQLPFEDNKYDLVICTEVLEHLRHPEKAIEEIARVSKHWCIISVPHEPFFQIASFLRGRYFTTFGNNPEHINHWGPRSFSAFLKISSLDLITLKKEFPWLIALCRKRNNDIEK